MKRDSLLSYCYIGPTILGLAQNRTLLSGEEADRLESLFKDRGYENAVKLIVPCSNLSEALKDLEDGKGLWSYFFKKSGLKNKEKNI